MTEDPAKQAWQASVQLAGAPPLEDVRKGADKFYRTIRRRNLIEYAACIIVALVFSAYVVTLPHVVQKLGSALIVVATVYVAWQLHRRASALPPESAGTRPLLLFARDQMVRQREALRSIFWWYILPFLPGLALFMFGKGLDPATDAAGPPIWARWLALGVVAAIVLGVWWLNQVAARRLQRHIDAIDALTGASE